jgi:hypothetical protein
LKIRSKEKYEISKTSFLPFFSLQAILAGPLMSLTTALLKLLEKFSERDLGT